MLRKSFRFWLMPLLLGPVCALALEIGEIQVSSALNQIFDARIPLPKLTPEELNKVSVKLAPQPLFKEFGLERTRTLTKLVFSIEYNPAGDVYVRIVSTEPIREPSLGLLLEFGWPRGKTFREFTIFLDPVQRLAKSSSDRTKTVLNEATVTPPPPAPAPPTPVATPPALEIAVSQPPPQPASATAVTAPPVVATPIPESTVADATVPASPATVPTPAVVPASTIKTAEPAPVTTPVASAVASSPKTAEPAPVTIPVASAVASSPKNAEPAPVIPPIASTIASSPLPIEVRPPSQTPAYKPGDAYGPVAVGEGLWKIALKLRPDPGITPEQMMQALFRANPQAFTRSGIDGLKIGSTLRIPSLREIASFSGSAAAKQLADTEETTAALLAETAKASGLPVTNVKAIDANSPIRWGTKAFPLAPVIIEPIESKITLLTSKQSATRGQTGGTAILTPVAAIPLLYEAVSEVMIGMVKVPGLVISNQIVPDMVTSNARRGEVRKTGPVLSPVGVAANRSLIKPLETNSSVANKLDSPDKSGQAEPSLVAKSLPEAKLPITLLATGKHPGALPPQSSEAVAVQAPAPSPDPKPLANTPIPSIPASVLPSVSHSPVSESKPVADTATVKGEAEYATTAADQYGPVVANQRLWDIATKLRPDERISKDVMMRALVKANPHAFAKAGMNQMKVGAMLRVPTLEDIVTHTGSPVAKELLQQRSGIESAPKSTEAAVQPESKPAVTASSKGTEAGVQQQPKPALEQESKPTVAAPTAGSKTEVASASGAPVAQVAVSTSQGKATTTETTSSSPMITAAKKEGREYGPVVANERLWDIATKLRPDERISKDVMMKALVKANPHAFAKAGMNQMKVGAMLRVPTLEDIVTHTGSPVAKQLLEQRQTIQDASPQTSVPASTN